MASRAPVRDLVAALSTGKLSPKQKLECLNRLLELSKEVADISQHCNIEAFVYTLRMYLVNPSKTIRTLSLRILRLYCRRKEIVEQIVVLNLSPFIARSLERDKQTWDQERLQALKLVRAMMSVEPLALPRAIIQALKAVADQHDDNFSRAALDTLCDVAVRNAKAVSHCNGFKSILQTIINPDMEASQESMVLIALYLLDEERARKYLRPDYDLRLLLAPLTETFPDDIKMPERVRRWKTCVKAVVRFLRSWTGVIALASDERGLRHLVVALSLPTVQLQDIVLDGLYEIFRVAVPKMGTDPFAHNEQRMDRLEMGEIQNVALDSARKKGKQNLLANYISALLIAFMDCGLIEQLVQLGYYGAESAESKAESSATLSEDDAKLKKHIRVRATVLLGELLYLSNSLLPRSQCARLQTLPTLVRTAASFQANARTRSKASSMIVSLHQYAHFKSSTFDKDTTLTVANLTGSSRWKRVKGRDRRLDQIDDVKLKIDIGMDDALVQAKVKDTQVGIQNDYTQWNWDLIAELLEGAMHNPVHVATIAKTTKFFRRLLSFLRPDKGKFIEMTWNTANTKYARLACEVLEVLMSCPEAASHLSDHGLFSGIAALLQEEITASQKGVQDNRPFSPEKVTKTMAREYFSLIGALSSSAQGLQLLAKHKIFEHLITIIEQPRSDVVTNLIMTSLDYHIEPSESRRVLAKALQSSSKVVKYLATRHLRVLYRAGCNSFAAWGIKLLVSQIEGQQDTKVLYEALSVLDEACDSPLCMESLIERKPDLLGLGKPGRELMLRFLSSPRGLAYLERSTTFISEEMNSWKKSKYLLYVANIEMAISDAFNSTVWRQKTDQPDTTVVPPPHLYGELVKTEAGAALLRESRHFPDFVDILRSRSSKGMEKRGALWVVGHVGCAEHGFRFLVEHNVISLIIDLAERSPCLSIRGTCFYVLGMLGGHEHVRGVLETFGWEGDVDEKICLPRSTFNSTWLTVPPYDYCGSWADQGPVHAVPADDAANHGGIVKDTSDFKNTRTEILHHVGNLSNHISASTASNNLKRLKSTHPDEFASASLMIECFRLMELYSFRLLARRFVYDLFGNTVVPAAEDFGTCPLPNVG